MPPLRLNKRACDTWPGECRIPPTSLTPLCVCLQDVLGWSFITAMHTNYRVDVTDQDSLTLFNTPTDRRNQWVARSCVVSGECVCVCGGGGVTVLCWLHAGRALPVAWWRVVACWLGAACCLVAGGCMLAGRCRVPGAG